MSETTILTPYESAVAAVKRGWKVIPVHGLDDETPSGCTCYHPVKRPECKDPGKHPVEGNWQFTDDIFLASCWTIWKEDHPKFNVGVLTGLPSNIVILDNDPRNGGNEHLQRAIAEYGPLPETYTVRTGSGGQHYYFELPEGITIPSRKLYAENGDKLSGIDVLSSSGQKMAILPGSVSTRGAYWTEKDIPLAQLPERWLKALTQRASKSSGHIVMAADLPHWSTLSTRQQNKCRPYALKVINDECTAYENVAWGEGSDRLYRACCNMIEILQCPWSPPEVNETSVRIRLEQARKARWNRAKTSGRPDSGQLPGEVDGTWSSAACRVRGKGRPLPPDRDDYSTNIVNLSVSSPRITGGNDVNPFLQPDQAEKLGEELITEAEAVAFQAAQKREMAIREAMERQDAWDEAKRRRKARESDQQSRDTSEPLFISGAEFLGIVDDEEPPLWGDADSCLWASGESLMIVGPPGVGKSTLTQLVVWARIGIKSKVLDFRVTDDDRRVLYLAMDRPKQIARAMRRLITPETMDTVRDRLVVHKGPLLVDITSNTEWLLRKAQEVGAGTIVVDSLKDILADPSKEEPANLYNKSRQRCLTEGIEWVELHHNRKAGAENKAPKTLDDVYGSRWLTAGAGSVVSLYGQPGDTVVEMSQIKTPSGEFIPKNITMNKEYGTMAFFEVTTLEGVLTSVGLSGVTVREAASRVYGTKSPTPSNLESTRNKLQRMVMKGTVESLTPPFTNGGTADPTLFRWAVQG